MNGYIYCGWIHTWVGKLSGEKFKKAFYKKGDRNLGYLGYNENVEQDHKGFRGEWKVRMKNGRPRQLGYYRASLVKDEPYQKLFKPYMHTALVDYNISENTGFINRMSKMIRDFIVTPNEGDHSLLLSKAFFQFAPWLTIWHSFFILGKRQEIEFKPW